MSFHFRGLCWDMADVRRHWGIRQGHWCDITGTTVEVSGCNSRGSQTTTRHDKSSVYPGTPRGTLVNLKNSEWLWQKCHISMNQPILECTSGIAIHSHLLEYFGKKKHFSKYFDCTVCCVLFCLGQSRQTF